MFPLGMYSVATHDMARAMDLRFLDPLAGVFVYLALGAWSITFAALLRTWARRRRAVPGIG